MTRADGARHSPAADPLADPPGRLGGGPDRQRGRPGRPAGRPDSLAARTDRSADPTQPPLPDQADSLADAPADPLTGQPAGRPADPLTDARRRRADRARQVADVLRRQVLRGSFESGTLPSEAILAEEYGVSRNAVREALDVLRGEGLVDRVQGVGTVVAAHKYPHGLEHLVGLAEMLREHGEVTNEVRTAGQITPPAAIAARLGVPAGSPMVYVERLRRLSGLPFSLDLTYLAPDIGAPLLAEDLVHNDIFDLIERTCGQSLGLAELTIEAINADPHSAAVLEAPPGTALLMVERLSHLADGRPVDLEYIRFRGDRLTMRGWLRRGS